MFLGCYDLRNALSTIASKARSDDGGVLNIHLNHPCLLSLSRNFFVLKVIRSQNFDVNNGDDFNYLWDILYNVTWPKSTLNRFVKDIRDLIMNGLSEDCYSLESNHIESLKDLFNSWLSALSKFLTEPSQIKTILQER